MHYPSKKEKAVFWFVVISGLVLFVWVRLEVVRLGFVHQKYVKQKREVLERNKQLQLEYANILSPSMIEQYAKENLGLDEPTEQQTRYISGK